MDIEPTSQDALMPDAGEPIQETSAPVESRPRLGWNRIWEYLVRLGLGEVSLRVGAGIASLILVLIVVWVMGNFFLKEVSAPTEAAAASGLSSTPVVAQVSAPLYLGQKTSSGITRLAQPHTLMPSHPRFEVMQYTVQEGDTVFSIAEKFGLSPSTILWGNYNVLLDNPAFLKPGLILNILPQDGTYYEWHASDGLNGVAEYFGVTPETIIDWPGNNLTKEGVGDYMHPNIAAGTWLFVPGGEREFITWSAPRITRSDPAVASVLGPGSCGTIMDGAVGIGTFIWPTSNHWLSGYDYSPETNHYGIDLGGSIGTAIYAVDNGVVVYAGWNEHGYGNMVVIDHGDWQSLYAHLSAWNVSCGQSVYQGDVIGAMGSTGNSSGPHLHFEMRSDTYGRVDPKLWLP